MTPKKVGDLTTRQISPAKFLHGNKRAALPVAIGLCLIETKAHFLDLKTLLNRDDEPGLSFRVQERIIKE